MCDEIMPETCFDAEMDKLRQIIAEKNLEIVRLNKLIDDIKELGNKVLGKIQ
jgi:hypothetical protein